MKKLKKILFNWSLSDANDENAGEETEVSVSTHLSIGENKDGEIVRAVFHPDAFFTDFIECYDEPPLAPTKNKYKVFPLRLKKYCTKISFNVTISPKLCTLGYVRVNSLEFMNDITPFSEYVSFGGNDNNENDTNYRDYLYIPMIVDLPNLQQRHGLFDDLLTPTLMILPLNPTLYRYKLTESFTWRYQYVRIREYTSLKMDVIGEIPSQLCFEIIGSPIRAILPNYMLISDANIMRKDLNERKSITADLKQWSVFENSFWIKIESHSLRTKLPLMKQYVEQKNIDFEDRGYIIQQYLGHTVLECIGPILSQRNIAQREDVIYVNDHLLLELKTSEDLHIFDLFPSDLIAHIMSFCDFQFVRSILCIISKTFYEATMISSCYQTAIISSSLLNAMLSHHTTQHVHNKMLSSLMKCKRVDVYALIFADNYRMQHAHEIAIDNENDDNYIINCNECCIEEFHLEFVSNASLHMALFNTIDFNQSLKVLKLTQCNTIHNDALTFLPNNLQQLYLMNTFINVDSWSNLKHLSTLIITKSANLHYDNSSLLQAIIDTLPKQRLRCFCIWDDQEENKFLVKKLIENHNEILNTFVIGGRICLFQPFSDLFTSPDALCYPRLEIITVSCLSTHEIKELIQTFAHQLRILEMYCPFVMEQDQDIYQWLLDPQNIHLFTSSLTKLEILMVQAFPHHMKRYMTHNKWNQLKKKFQEKFAQYRIRNDPDDVPLILFDFGIDLNKIRLWSDPDIKQYLIQHQNLLELNFGQAI